MIIYILENPQYQTFHSQTYTNEIDETTFYVIIVFLSSETKCFNLNIIF